MHLLTDFRFALRSLARVKGLALTVIVTLALGIGANAAIFSVVRGVLLRPLVNRDQDRLIYIRQSAPRDWRRGRQILGAGDPGPASSDQDTWLPLATSRRSSSQWSGSGSRASCAPGVVGGSYFDVMGLRAIRGRLLNANDDGPQAAGAAVLTYRFWTTGLHSDPSAIGKVIRLGDRSATIVGILEPSVPYPTETEIIANVVTSPHHLDATMVEGRVHRMTDLFGRLAPGTDLDTALAELRAVHSSVVKQHPEAYHGARRLPDRRCQAPRPDHLARPDGAARPAGGVGARVHRRLLERGEPDSRALRSPRRRAGHSRRARRQRGRTAPNAARREPVALRCRRCSRRV